MVHVLAYWYFLFHFYREPVIEEAAMQAGLDCVRALVQALA